MSEKTYRVLDGLLGWTPVVIFPLSFLLCQTASTFALAVSSCFIVTVLARGWIGYRLGQIPVDYQD